MTLIVQNAQGSVQGANAYADVASARAYYLTRGVDLSSYTDDRVGQALVNATDCMDARYSFIGVPLYPLQGTQCPRYLDDANASARFPQSFNTLEPGYLLTTMQWQAVVRATIQLAYRELKKPGGLMPDPTFDASGMRVSKKVVKAGPVEKETDYAPASASDTFMPIFPAVDGMLRQAGVLVSRGGGSLARG